MKEILYKKFNAPTIYIQKLLDISLEFNISLYLDNTINYLTRNENSSISMKEILYKKIQCSYNLHTKITSHLSRI